MSHGGRVAVGADEDVVAASRVPQSSNSFDKRADTKLP